MDLENQTLLILALLAISICIFLYKKTVADSQQIVKKNDQLHNEKLLLEAEKQVKNSQIETLNEKIDNLENYKKENTNSQHITERYKEENRALEKKNQELNNEKVSLEAEVKIKDNEIAKLNQEIGTLKEYKDKTSEMYSQYKKYMEDQSEALLKKFKDSADKMLKDNNSEFAKSSKEELGNLLNPLKKEINSFQEQTQENYEKELTERASLKTTIENLTKAHEKASSSYEDLRQTLRGSQKLQGTWGERILLNVLESSGLREGEEYYYQAKTHHESNKHAIVDVLVSLPENRHVLVDAKTSLKHYESYHNAENEKEKSTQLKSFLTSVKKHIEDLSSKEYHQANNVNSPDFTIMFIPIDSAFILAIQNKSEIQNFALKNNIILSSPSLLMPILRTIASLWSLSRQNTNAQIIADEAGKMYDKFCGFLDDLNKTGKAIDSALKSHNDAVNKLSQGRGNLIKKAHDIKDKGIITNKKIPENFANNARITEDV